MPKTKKTSGSNSAKRSTTTKRGTTAKRKTSTKIAATRTRTSTRNRKSSAALKTGSRVFKFKLLATVFVCIAILVLAVLGTVFYDKLVPEKKPITAKNSEIEVVQPSQQGIPPVIRSDKTPISPEKPDNTPVIEPAKPDSTPTAQVSDPEIPVITPPEDKSPKATIPDSGKPKLALIFDDMGYDLPAAKKLQDLQLPLTFSILPHSPQGQSLAQTVPSYIEIMVHVPMQANNGDSDSEQGLLRSDMTEAELAQVLRDNISRIPNAKGINNHTGSRLTQQLVPMQVIMLVLKENNMFFVDSVTSDKSVAKSTAEMLLVPSAARNVFLDHVADIATIKAQLYRAVNLAKQNGSAVAIGHPRPLTMEVVLQELPKIAQEIELVPVSVLVQ